MTTEEIKQAIEESIVPNNKKAISAQSLKNVLMALAENSGGSNEGLYFFGIYDCLNRDMIPTEDGLDDEMFTLMMDWNAMVYAKLEEIVNILSYEAETVVIPPINVTIIGIIGLEDIIFIPAVVTMSFDGDKMVFIITPCNEYKDGFLARIVDELDRPQKIGYTLCSDGSYNRFNPLCIFLPEENITLPEWVNEYNREVCKAIIWQAVEPSKIKVMYANSLSLAVFEDWVQSTFDISPLSLMVDRLAYYSKTIGWCTSVNTNVNRGIFFTDGSGIHRINIDNSYNPTTVTNLIEFPAL